jgi:hypothetical protein
VNDALGFWRVVGGAGLEANAHAAAGIVCVQITPQKLRQRGGIQGRADLREQAAAGEHLVVVRRREWSHQRFIVTRGLAAGDDGPFNAKTLSRKARKVEGTWDPLPLCELCELGVFALKCEGLCPKCFTIF